MKVIDKMLKYNVLSHKKDVQQLKTKVNNLERIVMSHEVNTKFAYERRG